MNKIINNEDSRPAANKGGLRMVVTHVETDENGILQAVHVHYSTYRCLCAARIPVDTQKEQIDIAEK